MLILYRQSKSHRTWTKQGNPSVMISSITDNCIPAIVCWQRTWLVNRNRLCCYWSFHTFLIADLSAAYHTHNVKLNRFCSLGSMQIVHPSELYAVYRTHPRLDDCFCCYAHRKQFRWTNRMPHIADTTLIRIMFDACAIANSSYHFWQFSYTIVCD